MTHFTIDLSAIAVLTDDQFDTLCANNPDIKFERTPQRELVIIAPTGGETGKDNAKLTARFVIWNEDADLGVVFDSSTCFRIPGGGDRSPDVAWVEKSRWEALSPDLRRKFPPICPDFVLELLSPSDNPQTVRAKMQEYLSCGAKLGWMLNPEDQQVEIYRPNEPVKVLNAPARLSGEPVLPGLVLQLDWLWRDKEGFGER
jgi:Uma2 family endonuclease